MNKFLSAIYLLILCNVALAQDKKDIPLSVRQVSGLVLDSAQNGVSGAVVILKSATDTLNAMSNEEGVFIFKKVRSSVFNLTVTRLGYLPLVQKYLQSDTRNLIVLKPIQLKTEAFHLKEVTISAKVGIKYKQ